MLTIIIKNGEPKVVELTYENIWKETKDLKDVEILVKDSWIDSIKEIKNRYVCLLESDCLLSEGYFKAQIELLKKNPKYRKVSTLSSAVGVKYWDNKFYGYELVSDIGGVKPVRCKKSTNVYSVQVAYVPGSIIHVGMLNKAIAHADITNTFESNLVFLSTKLSLEFWKQGDGNPVHINPNTTYVTTEDYVNDIGKFHLQTFKLTQMFARECI